jgi:hypothetical protein
MEIVAFITTESGDDLMVSFAVQDPSDPTSIESLTLSRTPKYESLMQSDERGTGVSFDRFPDDEDDRDLLVEVRFSKRDQTVHIETRLRAYELDVGRVDATELAEMRKVFHEMNRDGRFRCVGL